MIRTRKAYICTFAFPEDWDFLRFPSAYSEKTIGMLLSSEPGVRLRQSAAAELCYRAARMAAWKDISSAVGESPFIGDPAEWTSRDYIKNASGKPELDVGFINITHTAGLAAAVFSYAPVGIDAERERVCSDKLIRRTLDEREYEEYLQAGDRTAFFLESWTAKESCLKLTSEGLGGSVASLRYDRGKSVIIGSSLREDYKILPHVFGGGEERTFLSVCCPKGTEPELYAFSDPIELLIYINAIR